MEDKEDNIKPFLCQLLISNGTSGASHMCILTSTNDSHYTLFNTEIFLTCAFVPVVSEIRNRLIESLQSLIRRYQIFTFNTQQRRTPPSPPLFDEDSYHVMSSPTPLRPRPQPPISTKVYSFQVDS